VLPMPGSETNPGSTVEARGREILRVLDGRGSVPHVAHGRRKRPSPRRGARERLSWSSTITWCAPAMEDDPNIIHSDLCREITRDGVTIRVSIFRLEHENHWWLEVINEADGSTTWDKPFATEEDALAEVVATVAKEAGLFNALGCGGG